MIHKKVIHNEKVYLYTKYKTVTDKQLLKIKEKTKANEKGIALLPLSFDIETTSFYSEKYDADIATMYTWQFGIDYETITGRTWEELKDLIERLCEIFGDMALICWIQNFSFEWSFMKGHFEWNKNKDGFPDIFAKTDRNILTARYRNIEFRDSMALTAMSLARYQKNYNLDVGKLSGDLDYKLARHTGTKLTDQEIAYCINDVQVLNDWQRKYIFPVYLENNLSIPLTSTGIVREDIKKEFSKMSKDEQKKMRSKLRNAQPTEEMYQIFRSWLFRGGLVHANTVMCNYLIEDCFSSLDLKSAHPSQMLTQLFPWKFNRRNVSCFETVLSEARTRKYGFFGIFKFKNIVASGWHCLESKNKIISFSDDAKFENGRLARASEIKVCLTEIDWFNYEDLYRWDNVECTVLYQARLEPLPEYVRRVVMKYFELKETLPKDTVEYSLAKRKLNSCFGMAATSLPEREIIFDQETNKMIPGPLSRTYDQLTMWLVMLPQWAIYIAAYTRRDIVRSIKECGIDSVYYDTDSNKIINYSKHKAWFDNFNNEKRRLIENMEVYEFDRKHFLKLGSFDYEYTGRRMKVLGAKRYLTQKWTSKTRNHKEIDVVVAGMVKGTLEKHCKNKKLSIWEEFKDDLQLTKEESEKQTAIYRDESFEDYVTDYIGNTKKVSEKSCVAIVDIPFSMSLEEDFLLRVEELRNERSRMVYKGVL